MVHGPEEPGRGGADRVQVTKVPAERFGWLFTKQTITAVPTCCRILDALQSNINTTRELGFIKAPLDVKQYSDLSLAQDAAKRLK